MKSYLGHINHFIFASFSLCFCFLSSPHTIHFFLPLTYNKITNHYYRQADLFLYNYSQYALQGEKHLATLPVLVLGLISQHITAQAVLLSFKVLSFGAIILAKGKTAKEYLWIKLIRKSNWNSFVFQISSLRALPKVIRKRRGTEEYCILIFFESISLQ